MIQIIEETAVVVSSPPRKQATNVIAESVF